MEKRNNDLLAFGAGVGVGVVSVWALIELFPLILLGGAGYLAYQGLKHTVKENSQWQDNGQDHK